MRRAAVLCSGAPALAPATRAALVLGAGGLLLVGARLLGGLGEVAATSDGYPWGASKALDVAWLTGIAGGALPLALVAHVASGGRRHPLVRSAVLVAAIAYVLATFSAVVDLGRWWTAWALLAAPWWNPGSVLLEVALCAAACCAALGLELLGGALERLRERGGRPGAVAARALAWHARGSPLLLAAAIVLPLVHQSSLGALFLVASTKLHPLWHTPSLPALFALSSLVMGCAAIIVADTLAHIAPGRERDARLLPTLSVLLAALASAFALLRAGEVAWAGELAAVRGPKGLLFLVELALVAYPALRLLAPSYRRNAGHLLWGSLLALAGGALYRLDVHLGAFDPGGGWSYFPSPGELLFSAGLVAVGVATYAVAGRRLPGPASATGDRSDPVRRRAA